MRGRAAFRGEKSGGGVCLCALNSALFALVSSTCFSRAAKILRLLSCGREGGGGPNIPSHITNVPAEYHRIWPFSLFRVGRLSSDFSLSLPLPLSRKSNWPIPPLSYLVGGRAGGAKAMDAAFFPFLLFARCTLPYIGREKGNVGGGPQANLLKRSVQRGGFQQSKKAGEQPA